MVKAAKAAAQFVYQIPANIACERAFDCVIGEGQKQVGVDSREWSGAGGKNPTPTRINSLSLFNSFSCMLGACSQTVQTLPCTDYPRASWIQAEPPLPYRSRLFNLANYCHFLGEMVGIFANAFL